MEYEITCESFLKSSISDFHQSWTGSYSKVTVDRIGRPWYTKKNSGQGIEQGIYMMDYEDIVPG